MRSVVSRRGPESPPFHSGPPPVTLGDPAACYSKAVDSLARRSRSARGLERWLIQRRFAPEAIAGVIARLLDSGLLNDLAFARTFAHSRVVGRGFGPRRVALELSRQGVDRAMIDQVLAELAEDRPEHAGPAAVADAAGRRARALARLEPAVAERRLVSWLVRRGFGIGESARAARGALGRR